MSVLRTSGCGPTAWRIRSSRYSVMSSAPVGTSVTGDLVAAASASRRASGTPRARMPTSASSSMPRLRSTISCAMRVSDRDMRSASITTGMEPPAVANCGLRSAEWSEIERIVREVRGREQAYVHVHLFAASQGRVKELRHEYMHARAMGAWRRALERQSPQRQRLRMRFAQPAPATCAHAPCAQRSYVGMNAIGRSAVKSRVKMSVRAKPSMSRPTGARGNRGSSARRRRPSRGAAGPLARARRTPAESRRAPARGCR